MRGLFSTPVAALRPLLTGETFFRPSRLSAGLLASLRTLDRKQQLEVVRLFVAAARKYDDGHRPDGETTMDVLLDQVFPSFGSTALLALLKKFLIVGYFSHDRMDELIAPAFERLDAEGDRSKLIELFSAYVEEIVGGARPRSDEVERLVATFKKVEPHLPVARARLLGEAIERAAAFEAWENAEWVRFSEMPLSELQAVMAERGRELAWAHPSTDAFYHSLFERRERIPLEAFEAFVAAVLFAPETYALAEALPFLFIKDAERAPDALLRLAAQGKIQRHGIVDGLSNLLRWVVESRGYTSEQRKAIATGPMIKRMTAALSRVKSFTEQKDAQEAKELPELLESLDAAALAREVAERGAGLCAGHPAQAHFHRAVLRLLAAIPFESLSAMASQSLRMSSLPAMQASLALLFLKDPARGEAYVLSEEGVRGRGTINSALLGFTSENLASGDRAETEPWRRAVARSPKTRKALAAARRKLQRFFRSPFERLRL